MVTSCVGILSSVTTVSLLPPAVLDCAHLRGVHHIVFVLLLKLIPRRNITRPATIVRAHAGNFASSSSSRYAIVGIRYSDLHAITTATSSAQAFAASWTLDMPPPGSQDAKLPDTFKSTAQRVYHVAFYIRLADSRSHFRFVHSPAGHIAQL